MSDRVTSRNEWIFGHITSGCLEDRDYLIKHNFLTMLNKTIRMFKYNNLPDTIQQKDLETQLQLHGFCIWKEVDGKLYTFFGGLGGVPNAYYLPTKAIIANPYLKYNANLEIDKECVVMLNDTYYQGLTPLFNKYASLLTDAEISLRIALINSRVPALCQADNDSAKVSAEILFQDIVQGKPFGVVAGKELLEGIKTHEFLRQSHIKENIEAIQYIKGSWYQEIGIEATFNMKREAINEAEANIDKYVLFPTIDSMLEYRRIGLEKVNAMYGTNITVELDSVWYKEQHLDEIAIEKTELEAEELKDEDIAVENTQEENTDVEIETEETI